MLHLSHKKLDVYLNSVKLVAQVYEVTKHFPADEKYTLISQLRRAAISVCSNIAEGSSRTYKAEKKRFLEISRSSLVEIDTQIEIALLLKYLEITQIKNLENYLERVFMMLSKMMEKLVAIDLPANSPKIEAYYARPCD
jgi:four helix bundle protein